MIPLNIVEQFTRTFSLIVRLFGNIMSGVFIGAHRAVSRGSVGADSVHGPRRADRGYPGVHLQVLAMVFIGAAVAGEKQDPPNNTGK